LVVRCPTVSDTRPRRATIRISLVAFGAGAVIAGTATIMNHSNAAPSGLEVPMVAGYNAEGDNRARQGGGANGTADATALSGAASTPGSTSSSAATSSSSPGSSSSSSTPSTPSSTESSSQPAPPPATSQPPTSPKQQSGSPDAAQAAQVVQLVNQFRDDMGCDPLKVDSRLTDAAQKHSTDMAQNNYFNHTSQDGRTFDQRIRAAGYPSPAAENIAKGQTSAQEVMRSWMQSDGHRRNILNCRYSTIGVAVDKQGWLWTQDFGF
jgi:uncharacterized protein YkwD